jgi:hypothetical protein
MNMSEIIKWLLDGDVAIQYQVHRDLLGKNKNDLRRKIDTEGWGAQFLAKQNIDGHWGKKFYQPKWISTHYTLLDLRNLCINPMNRNITNTINMVLSDEKGKDGGILPIGADQICDVCVNGMFLNYASYFKPDLEKMKSIIDFIASQKLEDGGFNCEFNSRKGAVHSSLHSTISVLEGITEFEKNGYNYRLEELLEAKQSSIEFILNHQLYRSHRTGEIINNSFLKFPYPSRWYYDILRALDYFQYSNTEYDVRMQPAIDILLQKRNKENTWNLNAKYPGKVHFDMEVAGKPSRWNTLRALRVLNHFGIENV